MATFERVNPAWFQPGGTLYLPTAARSGLIAFHVGAASASAYVQQIVILDHWLPYDSHDATNLVTPTLLWQTILTAIPAGLGFTGDVIPCTRDDVVLQHDHTPFLPSTLRFPPVASNLTWRPANIWNRAPRWAYHGRVPARLDGVEVALCGCSTAWLELPPAVSYARGMAFLNVICGTVQYVLWRPAPSFASAWWSWVAAQVGVEVEHIPEGMGPTAFDPLPFRQPFQIGAAGGMDWQENPRWSEAAPFRCSIDTSVDRRAASV